MYEIFLPSILKIFKSIILPLIAILSEVFLLLYILNTGAKIRVHLVYSLKYEKPKNCSKNYVSKFILQSAKIISHKFLELKKKCLKIKNEYNFRVKRLILATEIVLPYYIIDYF